MLDIFEKIKNFFSYWYLRYLVATELYMVETWERVVIHIVFIVLFFTLWQINSAVIWSTVPGTRAVYAGAHL